MAKRETKAAKPARIRATGGCLCGAVKYEVRGELRPVWNCHCGQCRKFHGHFGAYTNAKSKDVNIVGRPYLKWFVSSKLARRGFCGKCGSSLFWQRFKGDGISIAAGSLDAPTRLKTVGHLFVDHCGDYYKIADRLDRFPGTMTGAASN